MPSKNTMPKWQRDKLQVTPRSRCDRFCKYGRRRHPLSWIERQEMNQVSGDSTEGWEIKYLDASLDDKGLDQGGCYHQEWVESEEKVEDNSEELKNPPEVVTGVDEAIAQILSDIFEEDALNKTWWKKDRK